MGLFGNFDIFLTPGVVVEFFGNHGLATFIDVNVLHCLHVPSCQSIQRFDG